MFLSLKSLNPTQLLLDTNSPQFLLKERTSVLTLSVKMGVT